MTTIRVALGFVAAENLRFEQMDVKIMFLHGNLQENIYMKYPEGFQEIDKRPDMACRLKKSFYRLKRDQWQWYLKFDDFMMRSNYIRCATDNCCYTKYFEPLYIILLLCVGDILIAE